MYAGARGQTRIFGQTPEQKMPAQSEKSIAGVLAHFVALPDGAVLRRIVVGFCLVFWIAVAVALLT